MLLQVLELERGMRNYRNDPYSSESVSHTEDKADTHEANKPFNSTDPDVLIKPVPFLDDQWKNKVVIGCTIAVALEVLIVLLMVMYWRQIRWTLRKLTCPCDYIHRRRHEPLQQQESTYETNVDLESDDLLQTDQEMQIYTPMSNNSSADGSDNDHVASSSGYSQIGFPSDLRNESNRLVGDEGDIYEREIGAARTQSFGRKRDVSTDSSSSSTSATGDDVTEQGNIMQVFAVVHSSTNNRLATDSQDCT